jgi:hypothetical protein
MGRFDNRQGKNALQLGHEAGQVTRGSAGVALAIFTYYATGPPILKATKTGSNPSAEHNALSRRKRLRRVSQPEDHLAEVNANREAILIF